MPIAVGVIGSVAGGATTTGVTTAASGSSFEAVVWTNQGTAPTVTIADNKGNTGNYVRIGSQISNGDNKWCDRFLCPNGTGGAGHTMTAGGTSGYVIAALIEITGGATSPLDQSATGTQGAHADPVSSGNITVVPPATGELLISLAMIEDAGATVTFTEANGFTISLNVGNFNNNAMQVAVGTKVVTTSNTYNASWSSGAGTLFWQTCIDSFLGNTPASLVPHMNYGFQPMMAQ